MGGIASSAVVRVLAVVRGQEAKHERLYDDAFVRIICSLS